MNLLLVKLSSLGDIVHTFPAVSEALALRPGTNIDWLVDREYVELVGLHSGLRSILPNDDLRGTAWWNPGTWPARRAHAYDVVVDAQGLFRSAILARSWRAPVVGADGPSVREWGAHLLHDRRIPVPASLHATDAIRRLMGAALGYDTTPFPRPASQSLGSRKAASSEVLLLHGTRQRSKVWPLDHWIEVAQHTTSRGLTPLVTWGNDEEQTFCHALAAAVPQMRIVPKLGLAEIAALIDRVGLIVTVDSGLGHLADWRGCPTIMLFQASNPFLVGPSGHYSRALWVGDPPRRTRRRDRQHAPRHPIVPPKLVTDSMDDLLATVETA